LTDQASRSQKTDVVVFVPEDRIVYMRGKKGRIYF